MICFQLRFPLGVFYGLAPSSSRDGAAEWAPSPVRLIGGLLAAAHEIPSDDLDADRAVLRRLCEARPPTVYAPRAVLAHEQPERRLGRPVVAELRGPSRWAPRNHTRSELKGLSPRVIGRTRTEVDKSGVAIGDLPVTIAWTDLDGTPDELRRLRRMASDTAWIGTSRSPVLITVRDDLPDQDPATASPRWQPLPAGSPDDDASLRVPTADLIDRFDATYSHRSATRDRIEPSGHLPPPSGGRAAPYEIEDGVESGVIDPRHWSRFAIVAIDDFNAPWTLRTPATYLLARAFRVALLDAFGEQGSADEAPPVLHGHGDAPHLAIVPLPVVGRPHGTGAIRGLGLVFPHLDRCPDVTAQAATVMPGLRTFFDGATDRRSIHVPGLGPLQIRPLVGKADRLWALSPARYTGPARNWVTVTPVVHSRWQKRRHHDALEHQVRADCSHVGLPAPADIEVLRAPGIPGAATKLVPGPAHLRKEWRGSVQGPSSHLRLRFERPVQGPVILGRARHFGVGLCVPDDRENRS